MLCTVLVTSNPIEKSIQTYQGNKNMQLEYRDLMRISHCLMNLIQKITEPYRRTHFDFLVFQDHNHVDIQL